MDPKEETEIKNIIKGLLISNPFRSTQQQLWRDYHEMIGQGLPLQKLGFKSFDEYLRSIPDVVQVYGSGPPGEVAAVSSKSQHISEMVQKQKKNSFKHKKFSAKPSSTVHHKPHRFFQNKSSVKLPPSTNQRCKPEGKLPLAPIYKMEPINDHTSHGPKSIKQAFPQLEENIYKPNLHFNHKSQHREENASLVKSLKNPEANLALAFGDLSNRICDAFKDNKSDSAEQSTSSTEIDHTSQVPVKVQINLHNLIQKFLKGIECTKLPAEYREMYKKNIHYEDYGYRSLIEMCSDLPKIFNYIQHSSHDYMLYDKKQPIPPQDLKKNSAKHVHIENVVKTHILEDLPKVNWTTSSALLPENVFTINDEITRFFPADVNEDDILDITIAEIFDLSKFWFYLTFGDLDPLMDHLQTFFAKNNGAYLIPDLLLEDGLYCVALYSDQYHRCVIVDILPKSPQCVRVFFIDYGTVENVNSKQIWFLPKQFGEVPCQAIRGRLTNIYPVHENQPWPASAVRRFEQLITRRVVVGKVTKVEERDHFLELYLADITNKDKIFYINDVFVDEGLALYSGDERKSSLVDLDCIPNVRYIHLYPEFYEIENGMAPTTEEMKYIFTNRIPLHHYMPQYFDIYYDEDINEILLDFDRVGRKRKKNLIIPTVEIQFDYSYFPDYLVDEIKELHLQDHPETKPEAPESRVSIRKDICDTRTDSKTAVTKSELSADGEKKANESVTEYFCNKKRISEIRQGAASAAKAEKSDSKNSSDSSFVSKSSSDLEHIVEPVPLPNVFQQLNINESGAMSVFPSRISTNPFLNDCNLNDTNPFRATNPFLNDAELDETIDTSQLLDLFAKPLDGSLPHKIVNNLRDSACNCKKDKQVNIERSGGVSNAPHDAACSNSGANVVAPVRAIGNGELKAAENTSQRVRTPPGFNSTSVRSRMSVPPVAADGSRFSGGPTGNPYYQRFPFQNGPLPQNPLSLPYVLPMQDGYFGCLPQAYSTPYNFGAVNWPQLFSQQSFRPPPRYPQ